MSRLQRAAFVLGLTIALSAPSGAQGAAPGDSTLVIDVVQRFLGSIAQHDSSAARATLATGARLGSIRTSAQGPSAVRYQSDNEFVAFLANAKQRLLERIWTPTVRMNADIASVWAPYDFHIDGTFSHCGIDVFDLVRTSAGWKIVSVVYTAQAQGCTPSPLGPPSS